MACGSCSTSITCWCRASTTVDCSKPSVRRSSASSLPITSVWRCTTGNAEQLRLDLVYDKGRGFTTPRAPVSLEKSAAGVTFQQGVAAVFRRSELEARGWEGASDDEGRRDRVDVLRAAHDSQRQARNAVRRRAPTPDAFSGE